MQSIVYVKSIDGKTLMPTSPVIARLMLKQGRAKVIRRDPFQIKLSYKTDNEYIQPCTRGIDTGSGTLGSAAVTDDGKVLYMSEVELRNDIKNKMDARRKYRRSRRSRKTRYRKARFLNRKNSKRKDRFSPTMTSKLDAHKREISFMAKLLPCREKVILETGTFDPHLMKNPALANEKYRHWGYQQGTLYGFANTRAFILARDGYKCQCCKGKHKDSLLEVHHIVFRRNGGSDNPDNLITLCHTCHKGVHDGTITLGNKGKKKSNLSFATQMNSIRKQLLDYYDDSVETFGYITKENRQNLNLPKRHAVDAAVIASAGQPVIFMMDTVYLKKCIPKGDFQQTKGIHSEQKITTGKINGLRKFDKVKYLGGEYFIKGRMSTGYAILMDVHGTKVDFNNRPKGCKIPKMDKLHRIGARRVWIIAKEAV